MHSRKIRVFSLSMVLVLLLTLIPAQAAEETDTGTDEGEKTYTVTLNGNSGSLKGEDLVTVTYSEENPLDLWDYPFTQSGYLLAGWSTDESGSGWIDCNVTFNSDMGFETLYAVWLKLPESGNYAIFSTYNSEIKNAYSSVGNVYCVELTDDFTMPVASGKTNYMYCYWRSNDGDVYYEGEKATPEIGTFFQEVTMAAYADTRSVILDGNGGTWDGYGQRLSRRGFTSGSMIGKTMDIGFRFTRPGYTLTGYNTQADGKGTAYPIDSITINENMELPVQILYAQWEPEYHLEDDVSLVIDGVDQSKLLESTNVCTGTGWTYQVVDGVSVLHLTKDYNGGSIICKRDNVNIVFDDAVSTKRIEVSGALTLTANGDYAKVYESDDTAIRAESVTLAAAAGNYKIVSEKNTAIQAKSLYLNSDDVRIEGSPAVPNDTEITCGEKVRLQTNRNSDGTISALYTYPKSVTLYGNGGKYGEADVVTVDYPDKGSLDLGQYAETVTLTWANADWSKAAKVKVFFLDADRKPVAEAVTALINGKSQKN